MIADISAVKIRKWQNMVMETKKPNGEPYSDTFLRTIHSQLSAILNYAVLHYGLAQNPCRIAGPIGTYKGNEMNYWTKDEFDRFIDTIKNPAYHLAFNILFYTGIREGELLALTPEDFLENGTLLIRKTFAVLDGQIEKGERLFYFGKGGLIRELHKGTEAAGLKKIRVHDLRHSHASLLINMGIDIKVVSERLGHESVKTTWDIYAHLYPETDKKVATQLQQLLDGKNPDFIENDLTEDGGSGA